MNVNMRPGVRAVFRSGQIETPTSRRATATSDEIKAPTPLDAETTRVVADCGGGGRGGGRRRRLGDG